ncbi:unnamed protein product [Thelazia callipaeda]|uniref:Uncharacterized protein n=1 Tax=Thelazia callipaeda TaxID=103827 RepID=A0A0N5CN75_THECL|nr:unnamed protein product [Thelazia callipaeda]
MYWLTDYKPVFTAAPSQPGFQWYEKQNPPLDANNFLKMGSKVTCQLEMSDFLNPAVSNTSIESLKSATKSNAQSVFCSNFQPFKEPSASNHALKSKITSSESSETTATKMFQAKIARNGDTESTSRHNSLNAKNESSINDEEVLVVHDSSIQNAEQKCFSPVTSSTMSSTTQPDNELVELKAKIDFLYSKINEIQQRNENVIHRREISENQTDNTSLNDNSLKINIRADYDSTKHGNIVIANSPLPKSVTANLEQSEESQKQLYDSSITSSVSSQSILSTETNGSKLGSNKKLWNIQSSSTDNKSVKSTKNFKNTNSMIGVGADGGIIMINDSSQEILNKETRVNEWSTTNKTNNNLNTPVPVKDQNESTSGSITEDLNLKLNIIIDENHKKGLKFLTTRQKRNHIKGGTIQNEKQSIIGIKRIQDFRDAIYPQSLPICNNRNIIYQDRPQLSFPSNTQHPFIQPPYPFQGYLQPRSGFNIPIQYEPIFLFPKIPVSMEHYPCFANSYQGYEHLNGVQYLPANSPHKYNIHKQFVPSATNLMSAFRHCSTSLPNTQIPANTICAPVCDPDIQQNSHNTLVIQHPENKSQLLIEKRRKLQESVQAMASNENAEYFSSLPDKINNVEADKSLLNLQHCL